jgi:prolyl-tRNA synthetase
MQDGKALQAGTSHFLGQNFAKAFDVKFSDKDNKLEYVWATSWGVSTRLVGALVMAHSDDEGLILPPRIAPFQAVIVPIFKGEEKKEILLAKGRELAAQLKAAGIRVKFDDNDNNRPGWKFAEYELKGVPVRIALGLRDLENGTVEIARRDTREKTNGNMEGLAATVVQLLATIQQSMYDKALAYRTTHITRVDDWNEFERLLDEKGGFFSAHWDGTAGTETAIKDKTKATIRCIPLDAVPEEGKCILTGQPSKQRVLFARAY